MKKILIFGAGRIACPCAKYLLKCPEYNVIVVDKNSQNANRVINGHPRGTIIVEDAVSGAKGLINKIEPDVIICLLPSQFMVYIAKLCIEFHIPMVNPSYISKEMQNLDDSAHKAGVLILCELGLDPGIDHMSAARTIKMIHNKDELVESFWSCCGSLPSLQANTNPFGYKLSWAPGGLVGASKREARFLRNGKEVILPPGESFRYTNFVHIRDLGWFEEYANANSLPYIKLYDMPEVKNVYRGTIRYIGWSETIRKMLDMGLFEENYWELENLSYKEFTRRLIGAPKGCDIEGALGEFLNLEPYATIIHKIKWLGLLSDEYIPLKKGSPRDVILHLFLEKLNYEKGEQDFVIMEHRYIAFSPKDQKRIRYISTLIDYGIPDNDSSVARTTGIPPAIGAKLILQGKVTATGVQAPVLPEIYNPCLDELEKEGILFKEREELLS